MNDREISTIEWAQKDAMKTEAIAFKIWCDKYEASIANFHEEFFTAEQLYEMFKKENPKLTP